MNAFVKKKQGSDNALENYFLDLILQKKIIDREIQNLASIIDNSALHREYKMLLKKKLFGHNNLYFENWWTLQDGLLDVMKDGEIRANETEEHGVVLDLIVHLVETIFNIPDESMQAFVMLEQREEIEYSLIALIKRMLDHIGIWLQELIQNTKHLKDKKDAHIHAEFIVLEKNISQLSHLFLETEQAKISSLTQTVFAVYEKNIQKKNQNEENFYSFSE